MLSTLRRFWSRGVADPVKESTPERIRTSNPGILATVSRTVESPWAGNRASAHEKDRLNGWVNVMRLQRERDKLIE